jgi:hypothetical protein
VPIGLFLHGISHGFAVPASLRRTGARPGAISLDRRDGGGDRAGLGRRGGVPGLVGDSLGMPHLTLKRTTAAKTFIRSVRQAGVFTCPVRLGFDSENLRGDGPHRGVEMRSRKGIVGDLELERVNRILAAARWARHGALFRGNRLIAGSEIRLALPLEFELLLEVIHHTARLFTVRTSLLAAKLRLWRDGLQAPLDLTGRRHRLLLVSLVAAALDDGLADILPLRAAAFFALATAILVVTITLLRVAANVATLRSRALILHAALLPVADLTLLAHAALVLVGIRFVMPAAVFFLAVFAGFAVAVRLMLVARV